MSKVIGYIKSQTDKQKAFDFVMKTKRETSLLRSKLKV